MKTLGVLAACLIAINMVANAGGFWAAWPVLAIAVLAGLVWRAGLLIVAAGIVGVNALSWDGHAWAVWPLLVIGVVLALGWARHIDPGAHDDHRPQGG